MEKIAKYLIAFSIIYIMYFIGMIVGAHRAQHSAIAYGCVKGVDDLSMLFAKTPKLGQAYPKEQENAIRKAFNNCNNMEDIK